MSKWTMRTGATGFAYGFYHVRLSRKYHRLAWYIVVTIRGWCEELAIPLVTGLHGIHDRDCGMKLLPAEVVHACRLQSQDMLFNVELLAKCQRIAVPIIQIPVHGMADASDGASAFTLRDLLHLRKRLLRWQFVPSK